MKFTWLVAFALAVVFAAASAHAEEKITGCLSGPNSEGAYNLKGKDSKQSVEVGGLDDLAKHVGHAVSLTGVWVKSGAEIGEKELAGEMEEHERHDGAHKHFKVSAVQHVSTDCSK
ncbi:MAG: hypothetical protein ACREQF_03030 [Candidatus Binataceae bacterium]